MTRILKTLTAATALALALPVTAQTADAPQREHRAVWMTSYLSGGWPQTKVASNNINNIKTNLDKYMTQLTDANLNVVYYHCRVMCDALYNSAYEPTSAYLVNKRGDELAFDTFEYFIEKSHENGIEVYAWLNPYRYSLSGLYGDAGGDKNYENSHPDWLMTYNGQIILNPGLEEVKQRIVDVIDDILTKYDVDGVVFDDYFYLNGTPMSVDADLYAKYTSGGGKLSQADWRRANVNDMVERVSKLIRTKKPWVVFGIGPAGVASPPNVTSEYGLPAAPGGGDWQYNGIYSDPLAWYKAGTIDFMSPQIYWPSRFDALSEWWANAAVKYNRHCYPSVTLSDVGTYKYAEFAREVENSRKFSPAGTAGMVYFHYYNIVNHYERIDGTLYNFGKMLGGDVYNTLALMPLHPWIKSNAPEMVSNVKNDGTTLTWTANNAGRYAIYRFPKNQVSYHLELVGVRYTNSYTLPDDAEQYNYYVATYDRYANLSTPLGVGATKQTGSAPKLTYPANGAKPVDLFEFAWDHESNLNLYDVEVAEDAAFDNVVGIITVNDKKASVTSLPPLTSGKTYYWRVRATDVNREHPVSEVRSFVAPRIALTGPAQDAKVGLTPTLTWSAAVDGADYLLEISTSETMTSPVVSQTLKTTTYTVPSKTLVTGKKYYARVTASLNDAKSVSEVVGFATEDKADYAAPEFAVPVVDGATLHANESIVMKDWEGLTSITVQIASSNTFPTRSTYNCTLNNFETATPELSTIKLSSSALQNGATYYLRARGNYSLTTASSTQSTDYTPVMTFVYSSEAGVDDLNADPSTTYLEGTTLHVGKGVSTVTVYSLTGAVVAAYEVTEGTTVELDTLPQGTYIVKAGMTVAKLVR